MILISFCLIIVVDLFAAKIAGYTFMWTTYETETLTYLLTVNARNLHWNRVAHRSIKQKNYHLSGTVAILRGGLGGPFPPRFLLGPPGFFLISRLSSFGWHMQGCQMHFVKIPAILSTAPDLSCVLIRKQHRENRDN